VQVLSNPLNGRSSAQAVVIQEQSKYLLIVESEPLITASEIRKETIVTKFVANGIFGNNLLSSLSTSRLSLLHETQEFPLPELELV
jgi:hypothetical protein